MALTKSKKKNIACIESLWDEELIDRLSVRPILEIISKLRVGKADVDYVHLTCNTKEELKYNISKVSGLRGFGILYLAFHGKPGVICLDDGSDVDIETLALIMSHGFLGWVIHFGSCSTLEISSERIQRLLDATGVSLAMGYKECITWPESAAIDLLLFDWLQEYKDMKAFWRMFSGMYPDLIKRTGLTVYNPK